MPLYAETLANNSHAFFAHVKIQTPYELDASLQRSISELKSRRQFHASLKEYIEDQYRPALRLVNQQHISEKELNDHKRRHSPSRSYLDNFANGQPICFRFTNTIANVLNERYCLHNFIPAEELLKIAEDRNGRQTSRSGDELFSFNQEITPSEIEKGISPIELDQVLRSKVRGYTNHYSIKKLEQDIKDFVVAQYEELRPLILSKGVTEAEIDDQITLYTLSDSYIDMYASGKDICYRYINTLANFFDYVYFLYNFNPCEELMRFSAIHEDPLNKRSELS